MKLIFTTQNQGKAKEVQKFVPPFIEIKTLKDYNFFDELEESQSTFKGNAQQKAQFIYHKFKQNCFSEDSGLEIESLNGEPGVFSARYSGDHQKSTVLLSKDDRNIEKVLLNLKGVDNRNAQFKTVVCLIMNHQEYFFEGIIKGFITNEKRGENGFGYDPIFIPNGHKITFAEMALTEKNKISHRAIALRKMIIFLENLNLNSLQ